MTFNNQPQKPFMTVVHGRKVVLTAFFTLEQAQADAASYWMAGNPVMPRTAVAIHGYDEFLNKWLILHVIEPGSLTLPWAVVPAQTHEETVAAGVTAV